MRLLYAYPPAWRARYGSELAVLLEELDGGRRARLDVVRAGLVERLRPLGLGSLSPHARAREGSLLVLYAWTLFVLGGFGIQKASEHWQETTPGGDRAVPAGAFDGLVVIAAIGTALVLLGVALVLPRLRAAIRRDGWEGLVRPLGPAAWLSLLTAAATGGLAAWAHTLAPAARNGHDAFYDGAFVAWVLLFAVTLFSWSAAAASIARRLELSNTLLRIESLVAAAVVASMALMTAATFIWWSSAHGYGFAANVNVIVPVAAMICATILGLIGALRAARAVTLISGGLTS